jgi:flagellar capping protein FliD
MFGINGIALNLSIKKLTAPTATSAILPSQHLKLVDERTQLQVDRYFAHVLQPNQHEQVGQRSDKRDNSPTNPDDQVLAQRVNTHFDQRKQQLHAKFNQLRNSVRQATNQSIHLRNVTSCAGSSRAA